METMSTGNAAKELGVTTATIRNWIDAEYLEAEVGHLPSGRRRIRVGVESVRRMAARLRNPGMQTTNGS